MIPALRTIIFRGSLQSCLGETQGGKECFEVVVGRRRQIEFTFTNIRFRLVEVRIAEMLKLAQHPMEHKQISFGTSFAKIPPQVYFATSLKHSISLNSSRLNRPICMSTRFSQGARSGKSLPELRNVSASHRRRTAANRLQSADR